MNQMRGSDNHIIVTMKYYKMRGEREQAVIV